MSNSFSNKKLARTYMHPLPCALEIINWAVSAMIWHVRVAGWHARRLLSDWKPHMAFLRVRLRRDDNSLAGGWGWGLAPTVHWLTCVWTAGGVCDNWAPRVSLVTRLSGGHHLPLTATSGDRMGGLLPHRSGTETHLLLLMSGSLVSLSLCLTSHQISRISLSACAPVQLTAQ